MNICVRCTQFCLSSETICCMTLFLVSSLPLPGSCYFYSTPPNQFPNLFSDRFSLHCSSCLQPVCSVHPSICLCVSCCLCMYLYVQIYPALPISHIEESKRPVTIPAWCKKGWGHCQTHPFIVLPYRCLGKNNAALPFDNHTTNNI